MRREGDRVNFTSKLGVVLAAAGSAVGLGNVWRFPTEVGYNGGAACILIYYDILMPIPSLHSLSWLLVNGGV